MSQVSTDKLIRQTDFEVLAIRLEKEKQTKPDSSLNIARRNDIIKEIISIYFILKMTLNIPMRDYCLISIEEFKVAKERFRQIAIEKLKNAKKNWWYFSFMTKQVRAWKTFLKLGYFDFYLPFGNKGYMWWGWDGRDPFSISMYEHALSGDILIGPPPNIRELIQTIFQQRFGQGNR